MKRHADVSIENHGSICIVQPLTNAANRWVAEYLPEDAMRWAGGVVVEPRYLTDIVAGMRDAGLEIR